MSARSLGALHFSGESKSMVLEKIRFHLSQGDLNSLLSIITPNIFHLSLAAKSGELARAFNRADIRLPDGWPVASALKLFTNYRYGRIAGSDLSLEVLALAERESYSVAILGGTDETLCQAYENIARSYPALKLVRLTTNPVLPTTPTAGSIAKLVESVNETPVDILLFCVGAPKSETHVEASRGQLEARVILCVGATVDFLSGTIRRAPAWIQKCGLEWLFRLAQEPARLWHRYLTSGMAFLSILAGETCHRLRRNQPERIAATK